MTFVATPRSAVAKSTIFVVDDHPIVRQGFAQLIAHEPDLQVCGGSDNVADALREIPRLKPDLVLVDISLKDSNGIDLITALRAADEQLKTLVWSMFDESIYAERALRAGAMGYLNKQVPIETVVEAIRLVLGGGVYLTPRMAAYLVRRMGAQPTAGQSPLDSLSDRELEVFRLIGQGLSTQEIAHQMSLSPKTVETHRDRIKMKMDFRNAAELNRSAVLWLLENG
jgi:DNA-binding NarL/FixJ family response regulator